MKESQKHAVRPTGLASVAPLSDDDADRYHAFMTVSILPSRASWWWPSLRAAR